MATRRTRWTLTIRACPNDRGGEAPRRDGRACPLEAVGPLPERAPVGNRPGGLLPARDRVGLFPPRPCPRSCVSLGRGRPARDLRQPPASLLCARALEPARPDSQ